MMHRALLLLGPTGSGKTPLGDELACSGLGGVSCSHFDFGDNLRHAATGQSAALSSEVVRQIQEILVSGALLEAHNFFIAEALLDAFVASHEADLLVLNGLPRHVEQAEFLRDRVLVEAVVSLRCSAQVVLDRLRLDTGGDRGGRTDDDPELVARKLAQFENRTKPLVEYYALQGARTIELAVHADTCAKEAAARLALLCDAP
jgi:adenylate kinase family enzyme